MSSEKPPSGKNPRALRCPVCGEPLLRRGLVVCRSCSAPHHRPCWEYGKGCATYGCQARTFVIPPGCEDEGVEFRSRGATSWLMVLFVITVFSGLSGVLRAKLLFGKSTSKFLLRLIRPFFLPSILAMIWGPGMVERRFRIDPLTGAIRKTLLLGGITLSDRVVRTSGADVGSLELLPTAPRRRIFRADIPAGAELWLHDTAGKKTLLGRVEAEGVGDLVERAEAAAHALDTTVRMPSGLGDAAGLPAGLGRKLAALPSKVPELPGEDEGRELG